MQNTDPCRPRPPAKEKPVHIIWDFDGTLLPNRPYDSEQTLMLHKLKTSSDKISIIVRALAHLLYYADNKEHLSAAFKHFYAWFMKGTSVSVLHTVCEQLAEKISAPDRQSLLALKSRGHRMAVLSCGTADLCERILEMADVAACFDFIVGNRFQIDNGRITGMTLKMKNPQSKVTVLNSMGMAAAATIAVGDGYTDVPMLDWSRIPVVMDPSGLKRKRFTHKKYDYIASISELLPLIDKRLPIVET